MARNLASAPWHWRGARSLRCTALSISLQSVPRRCGINFPEQTSDSQLTLQTCFATSLRCLSRLGRRLPDCQVDEGTTLVCFAIAHGAMYCVAGGNLWLLLPSNKFNFIKHTAANSCRRSIRHSPGAPLPTCHSTLTPTPAAAAATSKAANALASSTSSSASTTPSLSPPRKPTICPSTWTTRILVQALQDHKARPMHTFPTRTARVAAMIESIGRATIVRTTCIVARGRCTRIIGRCSGRGSLNIGRGLGGSGAGLGREVD
jgi:hypothetical protein